MNIGIYVDVAKGQHPRGVGFHIVNLLRELSRQDADNHYFLYYQRPLIQRSTVPPHFPKAHNFHLRPITFPTRWVGNHPRLWWDVWLPRQIRRDRLDVFHGPSHFLPLLDGTKLMVTIHDIAYFKMDNLYAPEMTNALRTWTKKSLERADCVIALSQNTGTDLESLGVNGERIRVIYGGGNVTPEAQIKFDRIEELKSRYKLPEKYILYVGTLHPRKNVPFLLRAFAQLRRQGEIRHQLVVVGIRDAAAEDTIRAIDELGLSSDVIVTGYVDDWEVPLLYKMADLFVLPTRYEGFTLVTLEAMHYGVPVISTDTSSIREGVGDAGVLVQLDDVDELANSIKNVLSDDQLRKELIARGKVQCKKFTWERCAAETIEVYKELCRPLHRNEPALSTL